MDVVLHNNYSESDLERGLVRITQYLDKFGRSNVEGNHTNFGYGGNIAVLVWDEQRWAILRNADKPDLPRHFNYQYQARELIEQYCQHYTSLPEKDCAFWWYKGKRFAKFK